LTIRRLNSNSRWTYRNVTTAEVGAWLSKHHSFCEAAFSVLLINVDEIWCAKCRSFSHVSQRIDQK
jgi:hypothetical protein